MADTSSVLRINVTELQVSLQQNGFRGKTLKKAMTQLSECTEVCVTKLTESEIMVYEHRDNYGERRNYNCGRGDSSRYTPYYSGGINKFQLNGPHINTPKQGVQQHEIAALRTLQNVPDKSKCRRDDRRSGKPSHPKWKTYRAHTNTNHKTHSKSHTLYSKQSAVCEQNTFNEQKRCAHHAEINMDFVIGVDRTPVQSVVQSSIVTEGASIPLSSTQRTVANRSYVGCNRCNLIGKESTTVVEGVAASSNINRNFLSKPTVIAQPSVNNSSTAKSNSGVTCAYINKNINPKTLVTTIKSDMQICSRDTKRNITVSVKQSVNSYLKTDVSEPRKECVKTNDAQAQENQCISEVDMVSTTKGPGGTINKKIAILEIHNNTSSKTNDDVVNDTLIMETCHDNIKNVSKNIRSKENNESYASSKKCVCTNNQSEGGFQYKRAKDRTGCTDCSINSCVMYSMSSVHKVTDHKLLCVKSELEKFINSKMDTGVSELPNKDATVEIPLDTKNETRESEMKHLENKVSLLPSSDNNSFCDANGTLKKREAEGHCMEHTSSAKVLNRSKEECRYPLYVAAYPSATVCVESLKNSINSEMIDKGNACVNSNSKGTKGSKLEDNAIKKQKPLKKSKSTENSSNSDKINKENMIKANEQVEDRKRGIEIKSEKDFPISKYKKMKFNTTFIKLFGVDHDIRYDKQIFVNNEQHNLQKAIKQDKDSSNEDSYSRMNLDTKVLKVENNCATNDIPCVLNKIQNKNSQHLRRKSEGSSSKRIAKKRDKRISSVPCATSTVSETKLEVIDNVSKGSLDTKVLKVENNCATNDIPCVLNKIQNKNSSQHLRRKSEGSSSKRIAKKRDKRISSVPCATSTVSETNLEVIGNVSKGSLDTKVLKVENNCATNDIPCVLNKIQNKNSSQHLRRKSEGSSSKRIAKKHDKRISSVPCATSTVSETKLEVIDNVSKGSEFTAELGKNQQTNETTELLSNRVDDINTDSNVCSKNEVSNIPKFEFVKTESLDVKPPTEIDIEDFKMEEVSIELPPNERNSKVSTRPLTNNLNTSKPKIIEMSNTNEVSNGPYGPENVDSTLRSVTSNKGKELPNAICTQSINILTDSMSENNLPKDREMCQQVTLDQDRCGSDKSVAHCFTTGTSSVVDGTDKSSHEKEPLLNKPVAVSITERDPSMRISQSAETVTIQPSINKLNHNESKKNRTSDECIISDKTNNNVEASSASVSSLHDNQESFAQISSTTECTSVINEASTSKGSNMSVNELENNNQVVVPPPVNASLLENTTADMHIGTIRVRDAKSLGIVNSNLNVADILSNIPREVDNLLIELAEMLLTVLKDIRRYNSRASEAENLSCYRTKWIESEQARSDLSRSTYSKCTVARKLYRPLSSFFSINTFARIHNKVNMLADREYTTKEINEALKLLNNAMANLDEHTKRSCASGELVPNLLNQQKTSLNHNLTNILIKDYHMNSIQSQVSESRNNSCYINQSLTNQSSNSTRNAPQHDRSNIHNPQFQHGRELNTQGYVVSEPSSETSGANPLQSRQPNPAANTLNSSAVQGHKEVGMSKKFPAPNVCVSQYNNSINSLNAPPSNKPASVVRLPVKEVIIHVPHLPNALPERASVSNETRLNLKNNMLNKLLGNTPCLSSANVHPPPLYNTPCLSSANVHPPPPYAQATNVNPSNTNSRYMNQYNEQQSVGVPSIISGNPTPIHTFSNGRRQVIRQHPKSDDLTKQTVNQIQSLCNSSSPNSCASDTLKNQKKVRNGKQSSCLPQHTPTQQPLSVTTTSTSEKVPSSSGHSNSGQNYATRIDTQQNCTRVQSNANQDQSQNYGSQQRRDMPQTAMPLSESLQSENYHVPSLQHSGNQSRHGTYQEKFQHHVESRSNHHSMLHMPNNGTVYTSSSNSLMNRNLQLPVPSQANAQHRLCTPRYPEQLCSTTSNLQQRSVYSGHVSNEPQFRYNTSRVDHANSKENQANVMHHQYNNNNNNNPSLLQRLPPCEGNVQLHPQHQHPGGNVKQLAINHTQYSGGHMLQLSSQHHAKNVHYGSHSNQQGNVQPLSSQSASPYGGSINQLSAPYYRATTRLQGYQPIQYLGGNVQQLSAQPTQCNGGRTNSHPTQHMRRNDQYLDSQHVQYHPTQNVAGNVHQSHSWLTQQHGAGVHQSSSQASQEPGVDVHQRNSRPAQQHGADVHQPNSRPAQQHGADVHQSNSRPQQHGADVHQSNSRPAQQGADVQFNSQPTHHGPDVHQLNSRPVQHGADVHQLNSRPVKQHETDVHQLNSRPAQQHEAQSTLQHEADVYQPNSRPAQQHGADVHQLNSRPAQQHEANVHQLNSRPARQCESKEQPIGDPHVQCKRYQHSQPMQAASEKLLHSTKLSKQKEQQSPNKSTQQQNISGDQHYFANYPYQTQSTSRSTENTSSQQLAQEHKSKQICQKDVTLVNEESVSIVATSGVSQCNQIIESPRQIQQSHAQTVLESILRSRTLNKQGVSSNQLQDTVTISVTTKNSTNQHQMPNVHELPSVPVPTSRGFATNAVIQAPTGSDSTSRAVENIISEMHLEFIQDTGQSKIDSNKQAKKTNLNVCNDSVNTLIDRESYLRSALQKSGTIIRGSVIQHQGNITPTYEETVQEPLLLPSKSGGDNRVTSLNSRSQSESHTLEQLTDDTLQNELISVDGPVLEQFLETYAQNSLVSDTGSNDKPLVQDDSETGSNDKPLVQDDIEYGQVDDNGQQAVSLHKPSSQVERQEATIPASPVGQSKNGKEDDDIVVLFEVTAGLRTVSRDSGYITPSPMVAHETVIKECQGGNLHVNQNNVDVEEEPVVQCAVCEKVAEVVCMGCNFTCYCSNTCQLVDWELSHHAECDGSAGK